MRYHPKKTLFLLEEFGLHTASFKKNLFIFLKFKN